MGLDIPVHPCLLTLERHNLPLYSGVPYDLSYPCAWVYEGQIGTERSE